MLSNVIAYLRLSGVSAQGFAQNKAAAFSNSEDILVFFELTQSSIFLFLSFAFYTWIPGLEMKLVVV